MSFEGEEKVYTPIDTVVVNIDDATNYPVEFLNSLKPPGMPHHRLILRVGIPIMLLQNLKPPKLCNGIRLKDKTLHRNIVEATILTGCVKGETVFVPRIPLIPNDLLFELKRFSSLKAKLSNLQEYICEKTGQFYVACSRGGSNVALAPPEYHGNL
ncbi:uncharacterized protein LOC112686208 [Sipha flava]|uniref:Uncharacterized protein LOC112686208 n=1 Tax=Sipha flava TaxID=143950 RepID=A0A8B8FT97_9HEMI|nr:uncharacterized protein LOC112686208 [Sipha flava]